MIYSCYNMVHTEIARVSPTTIFAQQFQLLRLAGQASPNPRQEFIQDLQSEIQTRKDNDKLILLCGNFNKLFGQDPWLMSSICATHDLCDIHNRVLGDISNVPMYTQGTKQLDYMFALAKIMPTVALCSMSQFNELVHSNHQTLFTNFNILQISIQQPETIPQSDIRHISSSSPLVSTFVHKACKHLDSN